MPTLHYRGLVPTGLSCVPRPHTPATGLQGNVLERFFEQPSPDGPAQVHRISWFFLAAPQSMWDLSSLTGD